MEYSNKTRIEWCEYIIDKVNNYTEDIYIKVNEDIFKITASNKDEVKQLMIKEIEAIKNMEV